MLKFDSIDQEVIKDANRKKILQLLSKKRQMTKQEIAKELGISIPTVTNNINELLDEGLVEEVGVANSTGGRKPVIVQFIPHGRYAFGVDISMERVRIILTNLDLQILQEESFDIEGLKEAEDFMMQIHGAICRMIDCGQIPKDKILGVGFSLPGTVNEEKMIMELAPNLGIKSIDFKTFGDKIGLPLYIENEANAAAFAELNLGIAKELRNLVYISVTQGIGTGIVIRDYLYKGKNRRAGEFGHMTIVSGGKQCNCGKKGCWELYASNRALLSSYKERSGKSCTSLGSFFADMEAGGKIAHQVWNEYLDYLVTGIQNIILILDPHYVIIGGEISQYEQFFLESLREKVFIKNSFYSQGDVKILTSILKENSGILGAALLPLQKIFFLSEKII